jgi:hypothetical protein
LSQRGGLTLRRSYLRLQSIANQNWIAAPRISANQLQSLLTPFTGDLAVCRLAALTNRRTSDYEDSLG